MPQRARSDGRHMARRADAPRWRWRRLGPLGSVAMGTVVVIAVMAMLPARPPAANSHALVGRGADRRTLLPVSRAGCSRDRACAVDPPTDPCPDRERRVRR